MVNVNFKNMHKFLILISLFISSLSIAETILECNGTERMDVTNGVDYQAGKPIKKTILLVLYEDRISLDNFEIPFNNITPTAYYWFWEPENKTLPVDIISGELNRVNGNAYYRKTLVDDENIPKYREFVFRGECNETEARF